MLLFICSHKGKGRQQLQECRKNNIMKEEYSLFVAEVRKWIEAGGDRKQAVDDAVDVCIEQGIIKRHTDPGKDGDREYGIIMYEKNNMRDSSKRSLEQQEKQLREGKKKMEEQEQHIREQGEASGIKQEISFRKGVCFA